MPSPRVLGRGNSWWRQVTSVTLKSSPTRPIRPCTEFAEMKSHTEYLTFNVPQRMGFGGGAG